MGAKILTKSFISKDSEGVVRIIHRPLLKREEVIILSSNLTSANYIFIQGGRGREEQEGNQEEEQR